MTFKDWFELLNFLRRCASGTSVNTYSPFYLPVYNPGAVTEIAIWWQKRCSSNKPVQLCMNGHSGIELGVWKVDVNVPQVMTMPEQEVW